ncbi:MAG: dihydrofolate reductase family protein, partial [Planctomycetes bacterium]|nr:dihydrofolate reductase family protein [Planctomycetota bacterium]
DAGCDVYRCDGATHQQRLRSLLAELGRRNMTNVLVEGGGRLFANLHRIECVDEVHAFIAAKIVGDTAVTPMSGNDACKAPQGVAGMASVDQLHSVTVRQLGRDVHVHGRLRAPS